MFDTLTYANKLKEAGFSEKQAVAQAEALVAVVDENLATKRDIELVKQDIKELETRLRHDIKGLETTLRHGIKELELRFEGRFTLMQWMMGVVIAGILSLVLKAFFVG